MQLLRVEIMRDYGDTIIVRCPTPIPTGAKQGSQPMRPHLIVSKADLAEESQKRHGPRGCNPEARVQSASTVEGTKRSERRQRIRSINDTT